MNTNFATLENTLNILSGLLTPVIAIIATWIAIMQMRTHRYKVKIDLFERRMRIFESLRQNLISINGAGSTQKINWLEYNFIVRQTYFLLNKKLIKFIDEIDNKVHDVNRLDIFLFGIGKLPEGEKGEAMIAEHSACIEWISNQIQPLDTMFADFMKMNKI